MRIEFFEEKRCAEIPDTLLLTGRFSQVDLQKIKSFLMNMKISAVCLGRNPTLLVKHETGMILIESNGHFNFSRITDLEQAKAFLVKIDKTMEAV